MPKYSFEIKMKVLQAYLNLFSSEIISYHIPERPAADTVLNVLEKTMENCFGYLK